MAESCPKCGAPKSGESCPACGLAFAKFDQSVFNEGVPSEIIELWKHVEDGWDEKSRHALFIERALAADALGYAASCYRRHGEDPHAKECLEQITKRLEQMLTAAATPPGSKRRNRLIGLIILLVTLAALLLFFFKYSSL